MERSERTCYTSEQLLGEFLNVGAGERDKGVRLEEVEDALAIEIGDDANMIPEVEAVPEMYATVLVVSVV
jgi:hypothetical protein